MPNSIWKDLFLRFLGNPSFVRKIQKPKLFRMLDLTGTETVLDAGCGKGYFTYELAQKTRLCVGVDFGLGRCLVPVFAEQGKALYVRGDVQELPFVGQTFDKILLSSILQVVENDRALLKECHSVLKSNGLVVLSVTTDYLYFRNLNSLKPELKEKLGALGKGYYALEEVTTLLKSERFQVLDFEFSPKKLGSLLYEIELYLWTKFKTKFFSSVLFPLFFALSYFDNLTSGKAVGNEILIKAQKLQT